ncbi:MAG: ferrochelatase [Alphaproteobacteria bacterium]|nr:ferrochelatase [Alphaproteobacteria bacterium]
MRKIAVVLFNLGGPDSPRAIRPFLFNLFNDRAIISLSQPMRWLLAQWIAWGRSKKAAGIYHHIGGKSPILELTQQQARALEERLKSHGEYKVFVSMRYWHPMSGAAAKNVQQYAPDHIVLLPLYPQFSTTTTGSSFEDWDRQCDKIGLKAPTSKICCYPAQKSFAAAHAKIIREYYWKAAEFGRPRILFSAHGLPEKVIAMGDPYQYQVEKTAAAIVQILSIDDLDYNVCYQSKVGPLAWIGPSTEEEIARAAEEKTPIVVVPIAFVSEHSETLVELDIEYKHLAEKLGVPSYQRVPALATEPFFIEALGEIVLSKIDSTGISSETGTRFCLRNFGACPCKG